MAKRASRRTRVAAFWGQVLTTGALALASCRGTTVSFQIPIEISSLCSQRIPLQKTTTFAPRSTTSLGSNRTKMFTSPPRRIPRFRRRDPQEHGSVTMASSLESGLSEYFKVPDEKILKAVEKAGNRAVPSDIAELAGVDLSMAKNGLVNLATLVGGDLEVSKEGDVVYNFPSGFRATLLQRSAYQRAVEAFRRAWPVLFFGIRVSFGVVLLASIVLIFSTIFFAATYANSSSSERDDRRRSGYEGAGGFGGGGINVYFGPSPFDFLYYRPYYGYYNAPVRTRGDPEEMGFLESTFSYIFGDGDPNKDLGLKRLEETAKLIRRSGGAVTAEQLAPLLTPGSSRPDDSLNVDESFVLPVLTALDGSPEVTEDGDIIYVFPSLQTSAMDGNRQSKARLEGLQSLSTPDLRQALSAIGLRSAEAIYERKDLVEAAMLAGLTKTADGRIAREAPRPGNTAQRGGSGDSGSILPEPLEEAQRPFSVAAEWKKLAAAALGVVNLGGALYLQNLLSGPALTGVSLPGYFGFVQGAMPFLLSYAVAFNVIPLVRWFINRRVNSQIEERNRYRRQWATMARNGGVVVERKLRAARKMATNLKVIQAEDVEYTTAKPLIEQGAEENLLDDFDMRLKSKNAEDGSKSGGAS